MGEGEEELTTLAQDTPGKVAGEGFGSGASAVISAEVLAEVSVEPFVDLSRLKEVLNYEEKDGLVGCIKGWCAYVDVNLTLARISKNTGKKIPLV